jgi:pyruvate ferredoxin oxidoreductase gamma subunit
MIEIRWHGRGGQGSFTAARMLGMAASIHGTMFAQAFPSFGPERRGAPVLGFTRIDGQKILDRSEVKHCDYVVVLDETLITPNIAQGLKKDGTLLINTNKIEKYQEMIDRKIVGFDATGLALKILGKPVTNTAMLGAVVAVSGLVDLEAILKVIDQNMEPSIREKNKQVVEKAYQILKGDVPDEQA